MEWVFIGLVAWWWCSRRERAERLRAERALASRLDGLGPLHATPIAVADDYAYWIAGDCLMRAPYSSSWIDVDEAEVADPLVLDDLPPAFVLEVLESLEQAQRELGYPRAGPTGE